MISTASVITWALAILGAFILGTAKAGVKGTGVIIVLLLALAFGSRASTGILMPLLIIGDIFAVIYYNRHAQWSYLWKLMPWVIAGVLLGVWLGKDLDEAQFRIWMSALIIISTALMFWGEIRRKIAVPHHGAFRGVMGLLVGFSTMVGNLAGPFSDLYFLAMRLPKNHFIGTAAWLFFLVNLFKLPFHVFVWKTITPGTLMYDLWLLPPVVLGLWAGVRMVARIHEVRYRRLIILLTAIGAILMLTGV